jgi:hypothetical protein
MAAWLAPMRAMKVSGFDPRPDLRLVQKMAFYVTLRQGEHEDHASGTIQGQLE